MGDELKQAWRLAPAFFLTWSEGIVEGVEKDKEGPAAVSRPPTHPESREHSSLNLPMPTSIIVFLRVIW